MDFQDLYAFYNVATEGSFSKAGIRMRVAQSALSRRVARLEHVLHVPLMVRYGRGVRLTEHGTALLNRAKGLIDELNRIERDVLVLSDEPIGKVRIAMPPTISQYLGPAIALECKRRFPGIELHLRDGFSDMIEDWVVEGKIDLGLMFSCGRGSDLQTESLLDEPLFLVAPSVQCGSCDQTIGDAVDWSMLEQLPLILPNRPNSLRLVIDRFATQHSIQLKPVMEVEGIHVTRGLVAAGIGYSIFGDSGFDSDRSDDSLRFIPFRDPLSWQLTLIQQQQPKTTRAFTEVVHLIKQQIQIILAQGRWQGRQMYSLPERGRRLAVV